VVDTLPEHPDIQVVLGSAHAYKFASVLGRIMAERVVDGVSPSEPELTAFRIDRPILRDPPPERTFVV
jgi:sarcosine oxidase